jgi:putative cardiolipin synthase
MNGISGKANLHIALRLFTGIGLLSFAASFASAQAIQDWINRHCADCEQRMKTETGAYILEKGEEALLGRAWLTRNAEASIDVQYFIWSSDNIGTLAAEGLLSAAERGVTVRVLVDDLLIDADDRTLLLLAAHPNVHIRIYNPNITVGTSLLARIFNAITDFRGINQRMHDKTAIFDGVAGITGGRNMADEYFDFDHEYNFRDRDILLLGQAVTDMSRNFDEFWTSSLAVPVEEVLGDSTAIVSDQDALTRARELHAYAANPANFEPEIRVAIDALPEQFSTLLGHMLWQDAQFISDAPGKNEGGGGGESTDRLLETVQGASHSVLIQSPYLIMPKGGVELFESLTKRGVRIRISTNSLASTDNIAAFSGYHRQRARLLNAGVELYEFKPHPGIQKELVERYPRLADNKPVFALHAKSMVIDDETIFIGTFNLDPRSANLNTEVGVLIDSEDLARQLTENIERDLRPDNSWRTTYDYCPDFEVNRAKRIELGLINLLPIEALL